MSADTSHLPVTSRAELSPLEVARAVQREAEGGVKAFEPGVRFHTFADSSINLTVALRARAVAAAGLLKHEFVKRLARRYAAEGIVIPFPTRTIMTKG